MGTFGEYMGCMDIPEGKRGHFARQVGRILNYGGMMEFERVSLYGHELGLLKPVLANPKGEVCFHYNYFEDNSWESACFDENKACFWSNKIGNAEFNDVVMAVYSLYEMYDGGCGWAVVDGEIISSRMYAGWLNHLLGTRFSMKKRFRLWENMEAYALPRLEEFGDPDQRELWAIIPSGMAYSAGSTELADLLYIIHGTATLTEGNVAPGTYPADVLRCRQALEAFYRKHTGDEGVQEVWALLKQGREARGAVEAAGLKEIASLSLSLPARVFVYLTAEIKGLHFWEIWKGLHESVYHDEAMKQYAPEELAEERRNQIETPVPPVRTSDFLRQDNWLTFWDTPEEAKKKPKYFISDDDRLYWWDGSDEVILSEEMDRWLKSLAAAHKGLMGQMADALTSPDAFLKEFLLLLTETDQYYQRIFPFQDMFYEFIANSGRPEYQAAVELFRRLADENREEGGIIKYAKYSWGTTSRKVTHNIGRLRLKRYLSVMANRGLRVKYFGF